MWNLRKAAVQRRRGTGVVLLRNAADLGLGSAMCSRSSRHFGSTLSFRALKAKIALSNGEQLAYTQPGNPE